MKLKNRYEVLKEVGPTETTGIKQRIKINQLTGDERNGKSEIAYKLLNKSKFNKNRNFDNNDKDWEELLDWIKINNRKNFIIDQLNSKRKFQKPYNKTIREGNKDKRTTYIKQNYNHSESPKQFEARANSHNINHETQEEHNYMRKNQEEPKRYQRNTYSQSFPISSRHMRERDNKDLCIPQRKSFFNDSQLKEDFKHTPPIRVATETPKLDEAGEGNENMETELKIGRQEEVTTHGNGQTRENEISVTEEYSVTQNIIEESDSETFKSTDSLINIDSV
ncbi:uncharacterized protein LOC128891256 [Hylaeus anthracinus]|uniref:uncharacterized protein LOC128891256 n=1 Tax=Hylaeus anthracinus TaxID=313031 RepID=UPI0023B8A35D|nr:uncharacterized protein LOC128891256 [Hylaeus anthracinus]XP_054006636.1 uncharacterized protein LOC128891256 [Hylaeus anthracinus]